MIPRGPLELAGIFRDAGELASAVPLEAPAGYLAAARPLPGGVLVRLAGGGVAPRPVALAVGVGVASWALVPAGDGSGAYDVVHAPSGLRAWRSRGYMEALSDAAFLAWMGGLEEWVSCPGARSAPPAIAARLAASGGRPEVEARGELPVPPRPPPDNGAPF